MRIQAPVDIRVNLPQQSVSADSPLSGLSKGDTLNAEVVNVSGGNITMKTQDGGILTASNVTGSAVQPGDQLSLMVRSTGEGNVSMRLLSVNGQDVSAFASQSDIRLTQLGVQSSPLNLSILSAMDQNGVMLSREAFLAIAQSLSAFDGLTPEIAAFAHANGIPLTNETLNALQGWLNEPASLGSMASDLQTLAAEADIASSQAGQPSFTAALAGERPVLLTLTRFEGFSELSQTLSSLPSFQEAEAAVTRFTATLPLPAESQAVVKDALMGVFARMAQDAAGAQNAQNSPLQAAAQQKPATALEQFAAELKAAASQDAPAQTNAAQQQPAVSDGGFRLDAFLNTAAKLFLQLRSGEVSAAPDVQLADAVLSQSELADAIHSQAKSLFGSESAVAQRAEQMNSQVQLTGNLQNFTYCQIPFQFQETRSTAELYVFENKKQRAKGQEGQSYTVLVALDTQNMGRVESVLRLNAGQLGIDLRVEDDSIMQYISRSANELKESITALSVSHVNVQLIKTPVTPQNAMSVLEQLPLSAGGLNIEI